MKVKWLHFLSKETSPFSFVFFALIIVRKLIHVGNHPGGRWSLSIAVGTSYPSAAPEMRFVTPICHANVNFRTGEICLDLLKEAWTPAYGLVSTLEAVQQLLTAGGEPDSPLNIDLARLIRDGDVVAAEALVRFYTNLWAMPRE